VIVCELTWTPILPARPDNADPALRCPRKRGHSTLTIGGDPVFGQYFAGGIEVRIYNSAVTQAQIQADMNRADPISREVERAADAAPSYAP